MTVTVIVEAPDSAGGPAACETGINAAIATASKTEGLSDLLSWFPCS